MKPSYISECANGVQYVVALTSTSEVEMIVNIVCAIITTLVLCGFRLYNWYKVAHQDGKITKEEAKEGVDIIIDTVDEVKDITHDKSK